MKKRKHKKTRWMRPCEMAAHLGCTKGNIWNLVSTGTLESRGDRYRRQVRVV